MKTYKPANRIEEYDLRARYSKDDYLMSGRGIYDTEFRINKIVNMIPFQPHHRVLDIGPGYGLLFELIHNRVKECHGVEPAESIVNRLNQKFSACSNVKMHLARSTGLPFDDAYFDIVIINGTLNALDTKQEAIDTLKEIRRVSKDTATVFVGEFPFAYEHKQIQGTPLQRTLRMIRQGNIVEVLHIGWRKTLQTARQLLNWEPRVLPSHTGIIIPEEEFFEICRSIGLDGQAERTQFKYELMKTRNDYVLEPVASSVLDPEEKQINP